MPDNRREPESRRETRIEFLSEQDGSHERDFKRELCSVFTVNPAITHAYLAVVGYQPTDSHAVALCLVSDDDDAADSIVRHVADIFGRNFGDDVRLDIIFVDRDQHADLQRVCQPFFSRAA